MGWCKHCMKNADIQRDPDGGFLICMSCGRVIDNEIYSTDVTFIKDGGQTRALGRSVKSISAEFSESRERTLAKGREEISDMVYSLNIGGGNDIIDQAHRFYIIAVERNFTRGRRTSHVAASCLYIVCRENKKAYLLIDFSDYLQINVYVLGAVFLQLCQLLRLENHPIVQKLVDPSLFIHRFTERLLGSKNTEVSGTALRIIASMKRDWMQTGRKPSGLCGAALYISALSHGLKYSKSDIVDIVHICEATLTKRLIEFENTESGSLTIEEFNSKAKEHERESYSRPIVGSKESEKVEILCEHKGGAVPHFAHGLCENCYDDFVKISGGLQGGSEPPAFQRCEKERMAKVSAEEMAEQSNSVTVPYLMDNNHKHVDKEIETFSGAYQENGLDFRDSESLGAATGPQIVNEGASNQSHEDEETSNVAGEESESLSDIDDIEVNGYLHSEEEKHYKKIIWEEMNKEYLEEQAAKEAAAAAAKESYEANFQNAEDYLAAQELAAAASAAVAKSRKERQQKRATEAKNAGPARTAAEATRQMLTKKRLSSRINYDVLEKLFDDSTDPDDTMKKRNKLDPIEEEAGKKEVEVENMDSDGDMGLEDDYGEEGDGVPYGDDDLCYDNVEDGYGFDYDDF